MLQAAASTRRVSPLLVLSLSSFLVITSDANLATASQQSAWIVIFSAAVAMSNAPNTIATSDRSTSQLLHSNIVCLASSTSAPQWWHLLFTSFWIRCRYFPKQPACPLSSCVKWYVVRPCFLLYHAAMSGIRVRVYSR